MIAYASRTGNVQYIVNQLGLPNIRIEPDLRMKEPFLLFTYTDGLGNTPQIVEQFIQHNFHLCKGVIASGNSNFGKEVFCKVADTIHRQYHIPIVRKIELRGFPKDYLAIIDFYQKAIEEGILK